MRRWQISPPNLWWRNSRTDLDSALLPRGQSWSPLVLEISIVIQCSIEILLWASLVAQMVKSLPAVWETRVQSLGQEDPLEKEMATHSSILAWKIPGAWQATVHEVAKSQTQLSDFLSFQKSYSESKCSVFYLNSTPFK